MKKIYILILLVMSSQFAIAATADQLVRDAESAIRAKDEARAFGLYKQALKASPTNWKALAGASLMCSRIGARQTNNSLRDSYYKAANTYANSALKVAPRNAESNYVKSVAMGRMALISSAKAKVAASRDIKKYADAAIAYNPKHAGAWHVLGRWNYGVATLNIAEKAAAEALFGGIPSGSISQAINCYKKSIAYDPAYLLNYLELGRAYKKDGKNSEAKSILSTGMNKPSLFQDDDDTKAQCRRLYNTI